MSDKPWTTGPEPPAPVSYPCPQAMFGPALPLSQPEIVELELELRKQTSSSCSKATRCEDSDMSMSPASDGKQEIEPTYGAHAPASPPKQLLEVLSQKSQSASPVAQTGSRPIRRASSLSSLSSRHSRRDRGRRRSPRRSRDRWGRDRSPRRSRSRSSSRGYIHNRRRLNRGEVRWQVALILVFIFHTSGPTLAFS